MKNIFRIFVVLFFITLTFTFGQRGGKQPRGSIKGIVLDASDKQPLEYANVILYDSLTSSMISGAATNSDGFFEIQNLRPGRYYLDVKFIGYDDKIVSPIYLRKGNAKIDLGIVKLNRAAYQLEGVQVIGDQVSMEYKIDKKVINVAQQSTSISGTAVDVLENAPSVTVDLEGNVQLRGSSDFLVLIDNKPTVFDASDALDQIPASAIKQIEIITNPSAKYDPEGTSGIINIVTKKNSLNGFNGQVNLNAGSYERYGGDVMFNYRTGDFNLFFGADYNKRKHPGNRNGLTETVVGDTSTFLQSESDQDRKRNSYGFRGGFSFDLTDYDMISLQGRFGSREFGGTMTSVYNEWSSPAGLENNYNSIGDHSRKGDYYNLNFDYTHKFNNEGHKLVLQAYYSDRNSDDSDITQLSNTDDIITSGQKFVEEGPESRFTFNADYKLPFNDKHYLEAGYKASLREEETTKDVYNYDTALDDYIFIPEFSNSAKYTKDIHALYSTYTAEAGRFGYQVGLRGEYTYRTMELAGANETYKVDRIDFFPTVHLSYSLEENSQMMASYSRRIHRPHGHSLEPFLTWMDSYNVRIGNPDLQPEYINSFEAGYQKHFQWGSVSAEAYYRVTTEKFERVRSVYDANIMLHSYENVGSSYSLGSELMFSTSPFKWWNLNLTGNLYNYKQDGELYGKSYNSESFNWNVRMNNQFEILPTTKLQFMFMFNSPSVTSQGRREGMYMLNAAVRHEIIPQVLMATLQVRDILGSARHEFTSEGPGFYSTMEMSRKSPMLMLSLSYNINNFKKETKRENDNGEDMQMDEEF